MERFALLSPTQDPYRPHAKRAMSDMGIGYGACEHLELRDKAAKMLAESCGHPERPLSDSMAPCSPTNMPTNTSRMARGESSKRRPDTPGSGYRHKRRRR